jgi:hypothetical protein
MHQIRLRTEIIFLLCLGVIFPAIAHSQSWDYQSYPDGEDISKFLDQPLYPGYITLDETGATPNLHMFIGKPTKCFRGSLEAKVTRTPDTTAIVARRDLKGCGSARFVIRNDGTGGRREILRDGKWVWDGLEHGLTLKRE